MTTPHVSPELLAMVMRGDLPPRTLVTLVRHHLSELCPECRQAFDSLESGAAMLRGMSRSPAADDGGDGYATAFSRATGHALREAGRLRDREADAQRDLRELLALPEEARASRIEGAHSRFRSPHLADLLLAESGRRVGTDPTASRHLAQLAQRVLLHAAGGGERVEVLRVRSLASEANAIRAGGDLTSADGLFRRVRSRLARQPCNDSELYADVASLEASLRQDQRRFGEAERLLARAVLLYRQAGRDDGVAKALIQKGSVHQLMGEPEAALDCLEEAARSIDGDEQPDLFLCNVSNRALCLCDLDRHEEARDLVEAQRQRFASGRNPWSRLRLHWLEGRILHGLGEDATAERRLLEARDGFLAAGNDFNAALVSLDLAVLYLEQGRGGELKELAAGMGQAFRARQVQREEMAALLLFQQAVAAERVTAHAVRRLRGYLEHCREDLAARCGVPS
jgi:tetratricopeptide (TPR) repeat protein